MEAEVLAIVVNLLTKAPQEIADVEKMIAAIGADKSVLGKVKDSLNGVLQALNDLGI